MLFPQLNGNDGDKSYDFTFSNGTLNTGDIDFAVKFNSEAQDSPNMVANPYPSAIKAIDFITANTDIVDEIFFWSPNTPPNNELPRHYTMNFSMEDISMHNGVGGIPAASNPLAVPNGYITTARAFGFKAKEAGTVRFTNAMRVKDNNTSSVPRPTNVADRVWVQIKNGQYQMQNTTLLGFSELTTDGLDQGYDSNRLATIVSLYTHLDTESGELGIQSRKAFEDNAKVLMGFSTMLDANLDYRISLGNIEGSNLTEVTVYLIDNELNIITKLNEGDYIFQAEKGTYDRRFTLQFIDEGVLGNQKQELSTVIIAPNPAKNVVNISNSQQLNLERLDIYDLRGRLLQSIDLKNMGTLKSINVSTLASATYLVKISGKEGQITQRLLKE